MDRTNILATIADLKAELVNIEDTKKQIESSIKTLSQLLESPLLAIGVVGVGRVGETTLTNLAAVKERRTRTKFPGTALETAGAPIPSERVHAALDKMHGSFKRGELKNNAANDGNGPIAEGTFANIFIKLIKREQIVCVEGAIGQRDAAFMKADEANNRSNPSLELFDVHV